MQKRNDAAQALEDLKSDIGWGSQIRSYVLDGDLDRFIEASLKQGL